MGRLLRLAAVCCSFVTAEAAVFKWAANDGARRWTPAQETFGLMPLLGMNPVPTSPPKLEESKGHKRAGGDNTCAYVNGDPGMLPGAQARLLYCQALLTWTKESPCTAMWTRRVSTTR